MGTEISKILTQPLYDVTGLEEYLDTAAGKLKKIAFGIDDDAPVDGAGRDVNLFWGKNSASDPDDASSIPYASGGFSVDDLKPGESGANVTETRTANDVEYGVGKAVAESGATLGAKAGTNLKNASGTVLSDSDVVTSEGTSADTSAVSGTAASTVKSGAVRANAGLNSDGTVGTGKVASANALHDLLIGNAAVVDRVFAGEVYSQATFTRLLAAGTVSYKIAAGDTLLANDITAENLAAMSATLGEVAVGLLLNTYRTGSPTAMVRLSGDFTIPSSVLRYMDLADSADYFIYHDFIQVPRTTATMALWRGNMSMDVVDGNKVSFLNDGSEFAVIEATLSGSVPIVRFASGLDTMLTLRGTDGSAMVDSLWFGGFTGWHFVEGAGPVAGSGTGLRIDIGTTNHYFFGASGKAYADDSWNTFSPTPPKAPEDMSASDWLAWAYEDARKPNKPYRGLPGPDHPEVVAEARRTKKGRAAVTERHLSRYGKDISKIAIGSARYSASLHAALAGSASFDEFKERMLAA